LIDEKDIVVATTRDGYIKRTNLDNYRNQHRGGKGVIALKTKKDDLANDIYITSTHNYLLFFTNKGKLYRLKGYQIPEGGRQAKGMPIINWLDLGPEEKITSIIPISEFKEEQYLFMTTQQGLVKKTPLEEFNTNYTGLIALGLKEDDKLVDAKLTAGDQDIILGTKEGLAIRFPETDVRSMGRNARGVKGISLNKDDQVVAMDIVDDNNMVGAKVTYVDDDGELHRGIVIEPHVSEMGADEAYDPHKDEMVDPSEYPMGTVNIIYGKDEEIGDDDSYFYKFDDMELVTSVYPARKPDVNFCYYAGWDYYNSQES